MNAIGEIHNPYRILWIDVLRIFACILIVIMHSPIPSDESNGLIQSSISYFTAPGIGLFFMISGWLLLPAKLDAAVFLKKRLPKLAIPLVFWSLVYMLLVFLTKGTETSIRHILSLPFSNQGNPTLWFLYTLIGLYLITPVISPWLAKSTFKEGNIYLSLFILGYCYPLIATWLNLNTTDTSYIYYFYGYGGYYYLGWYMKRFGDKIKMKHLALGFVASIALAVIFKLTHVDIDFYSLFWYKSILIVIPVVFWFKLFSASSYIFDKASQSVQTAIRKISHLSFGIYLIHFAIIRLFLVRWSFIQDVPSFPLQTLLIATISFFTSFFISYLISQLKIGKYLIGYTSAI